MTAVETKLPSCTHAHIGSNFVQHVFAFNEAVGNDPRTYICENNKLNCSIRNPVSVPPSAVADFLDHRFRPEISGLHASGQPACRAPPVLSRSAGFFG